MNHHLTGYVEAILHALRTRVETEVFMGAGQYLRGRLRTNPTVPSVLTNCDLT